VSSKDSHDYQEYAERFEQQPEARRNKKAKPKPASAHLAHGIVIRARGHHFDVETTAASETDGVERVRVCEVRGRLLLERGRDTLVAVGDRVWVLPEGAKKGLIERVDARHSVLSRQHPGEARPAEDVILANPDQALVVFAAARPEPHLRMLDRFLVIAEANELPAILCVNKVELTGEAVARDLFDLYAHIGYPVIYTSAREQTGIDALRELLTDRVTVVTGPSGVGKSSLINAVHPDAAFAGRRSARLHGQGAPHDARRPALPPALWRRLLRGRHAGHPRVGAVRDRRRQPAFLLPGNGRLSARLPLSRLHARPRAGCAVRAAVARGEIAEARYDSYLRLLRGEE
jgi:ribosome biogenesis GTPase